MARRRAPSMASALPQIPENEEEQQQEQEQEGKKKSAPTTKTITEAVSHNKCRPFSRETKKTVLSFLSYELAARAARAPDLPLREFLTAAAEARAAVRVLGRRLGAEPRVCSAMYEDFECAGFRRGGAELVVDPKRRAAANAAAAAALRRVTWEDVLARGTKFYSEGFSEFCDRKMGELVGAGRWGEALLKAFFGAAKTVWRVHLLARCGLPAVGIFRVERGAEFDGEFMEEWGRGGAGGGTVVVMLAPGFYIPGGAVKCVVRCGGSLGGGGEGGGFGRFRGGRR